jgi:2-haloacid dehalogenase
VSQPAGKPNAVVFDVGRVLYQWQLRALFEQLIADPQELDWFLANVVTEGWHHQHDAGRPLAEMIPERQALFPRYAHLIEAYATRFLDTVPGPVDGTHALVERLAARGVPLYALTNFGVEFWAEFRPTAPIFDRFADIVVSGAEQCAKPDPAIYAIAERRFGHTPEALFFTDDNPANVAAAQVRGWDAEVFTDAVALEAALTTRGLL